MSPSPLHCLWVAVVGFVSLGPLHCLWVAVVGFMSLGSLHCQWVAVVGFLSLYPFHYKWFAVICFQLLGLLCYHSIVVVYFSLLCCIACQLISIMRLNKNTIDIVTWYQYSLASKLCVPKWACQIILQSPFNELSTPEAISINVNEGKLIHMC